MLPRILIGGLVGGVLVFFAGFLCHAILELQTRTIWNLPDEPALVEFLKGQDLKHGLYGFPGMPKSSDPNEQAKLEAELNERYKAGPSGMLLIAPRGEDMMSAKMLLLEFATDVVAALIGAWIVSLLAPEVGFVRRWAVVVLLGVFAWASIPASYGIWYRFPHAFVHDELFCAMIEWGVAGLALAGIVRTPHKPLSSETA